jgi:hypothetical protein
MIFALNQPGWGQIGIARPRSIFRLLFARTLGIRGNIFQWPLLAGCFISQSATAEEFFDNTLMPFSVENARFREAGTSSQRS